MFYESQLHESSTFSTLTYDPEKLPADGSLKPEHLRDYLKRLRSAVAPARFRFVAVGEYGDLSRRPHYHAILFGLGPRDYAVLDKKWGHGFTYHVPFTIQTAGYVCGYVIKKLTRPDHPALEGRYPEFKRASNRPGIGHGAMRILADQILKNPDLLLSSDGDVPTHLSMAGKSLPLGRYLREALRKELGIDEAVSLRLKSLGSENRRLELRAMLEASGHFEKGLLIFPSSENYLTATQSKRDRVHAKSRLNLTNSKGRTL